MEAQSGSRKQMLNHPVKVTMDAGRGTNRNVTIIGHESWAGGLASGLSLAALASEAQRPLIGSRNAKLHPGSTCGGEPTCDSR